MNYLVFEARSGARWARVLRPHDELHCVECWSEDRCLFELRLRATLDGQGLAHLQHLAEDWAAHGVTWVLHGWEGKHLPRRGVARTPTRRMNVERGHTLVRTPSDLGWTPLR